MYEWNQHVRVGHNVGMTDADMAAIGRGSVMIGGASGGIGGPGTGFLIILPLMLASVAGGMLYEWSPLSPWIVVAGVTAICVATAAVYLRDPRQAER